MNMEMLIHYLLLKDCYLQYQWLTGVRSVSIQKTALQALWLGMSHI